MRDSALCITNMKKKKAGTVVKKNKKKRIHFLLLISIQARKNLYLPPHLSIFLTFSLPSLFTNAQYRYKNVKKSRYKLINC